MAIVISDLGKIKWLLVPSFGENILAEQSTSFGHDKFRLRQNKVAAGGLFSVRILAVRIFTKYPHRGNFTEGPRLSQIKAAFRVSFSENSQHFRPSEGLASVRILFVFLFFV